MGESRAENALLPQLTDEGSTMEMIKSIVEVYWTVFVAFTESHPQAPVMLVTEGERDWWQPPIYVMHTMLDIDPEAIGASNTCPGLSALPRGTDTQLQRAYMNLWQCDFSLVTLLKPAGEKLREVGAHVSWLHVTPSPEFTLRFANIPADPTNHSVMGITAADGEQFIADFTGAQFGYNPDDWFMSQQEYLDRYTLDGSRWLDAEGTAELDAMAEVFWPTVCGVEGKPWLDKVREVAYGLDWTRLSSLEREERLRVVQTEARFRFEILRLSS